MGHHSSGRAMMGGHQGGPPTRGGLMQQQVKIDETSNHIIKPIYKPVLSTQGGSMGGGGSQRNKIFGGAGTFNYMGQQQHGNNRMIRKQHGYNHHSVQQKGFDPSGVPGGHDDSQVKWKTSY